MQRGTKVYNFSYRNIKRSGMRTLIVFFPLMAMFILLPGTTLAGANTTYLESINATHSIASISNYEQNHNLSIEKGVGYVYILCKNATFSNTTITAYGNNRNITFDNCTFYNESLIVGPNSSIYIISPKGIGFSKDEVAENSNITIAYRLRINVFVPYGYNQSIPAILALIGIKYAKRDLKLFSIPFLILFILINVYTFQPNAADENKMGVYILFILAIFSAYVLEALWRKGIFSKVLAGFLILITIGGFISPYYYWITKPFVLFSKPQLETAQFILNNTSPNSIFATNDYENRFQLVSSIGARETLISIYPYVSLDVHTLPLETLVNINNEIIEDASCRAAEEYNVSYVYFRTSNLNDTEAFNNNSNFSEVYFKVDNQTDNPDGRYLIIYKSLCKETG